MPSERGKPQVWQPPRDGAQHGHPAPGQGCRPAQDDRGDHRDQQARDLAVDRPGSQHDHDDPGRHREVGRVRPRERAGDVQQPGRGGLVRDTHPQHVGELPGSDLDADAGQESDQDGAGQEVRQEAEPGQPGQQQQPAASRAASPASRTYRGEPVAASPARAALSMAAVAESAPTTRWRDEPRMANAAIGSSSVYRPVTTGIPAIFAYPRATGMLTAASVMPASTSAAM